MKFIYADSNDSIITDDFDYENDWRIQPKLLGEKRSYAHHVLGFVPYDGLLLSMAFVKSRMKFSEQLRLLRDGVSAWFGLNGKTPEGFIFIGDCGAYSYINETHPRYTVEEVMAFYEEGGFSHGIAPDHIVRMCDFANPPRSAVPDDCQYRYELTLANAHQFLTLSESANVAFDPVGAVQGWSPQSMASAAVDLEKMGYRYLAIGGLAGLKNEAIMTIVGTIRQSIKPTTKIHLLGFSNADNLQQYRAFNITSIDSTSPMLRSFKDSRKNYYASAGENIAYHTAIRIPESLGNNRLLRSVKRGRLSFEYLARLECRAMQAFRDYGRHRGSLDSAVDAIVDYQKHIVLDHRNDDTAMEKQSLEMRQLCRQTLTDRPWETCNCEACRLAGIDIILFRGNVRNKLRGMHNLNVYHRHIKALQARPIPLNVQISTVQQHGDTHQDSIYSRTA